MTKLSSWTARLRRHLKDKETKRETFPLLLGSLDSNFCLVCGQQFIRGHPRTRSWPHLQSRLLAKPIWIGKLVVVDG
jgi:hypothetical protein